MFVNSTVSNSGYIALNDDNGSWIMVGKDMKRSDLIPDTVSGLRTCEIPIGIARN
jgi:hypothetical protein